MKSLIVICALLTFTLVIRERQHTQIPVAPIPVAPIPVCPTQMPLAPHHSWHVAPDTLRFRMGAFTCNTQPTRGNTDNG